MLTVGIIIILIVGFLVLNLILPNSPWQVRLGLSFPVGMGLQTILMLLINMLGLRFTLGNTLAIGLLMLLILLFPLYRRRQEFVLRLRKAASQRIDFTGFNMVWLLFVILLVLFEGANLCKCMYFPTSDRDSLAGFETIGYIMAQEHTVRDLSIFRSDYMPEIHNAGSYIVYAPMVQLSYAFVYILGAETSKIVPGLMYLSFVLAFYGILKRTVGMTGAAIGTFFMMMTPEMIGFSSLSITNVIHAVSASMGIIHVAMWLRDRKQGDLLLATLLLGLNVWTRTDGVVFILAALTVVFADALRRRTAEAWKSLAVLTCSFLPALLWMAFSGLNNIYAENIIIDHPYWDGEKAMIIWDYMKLHLTNTTFYGWTFAFFLLSMLINGRNLLKHSDNLPLLTMFLVALALYMAVLYQIDYKWDSIQNVLAYSAKRFLFCFVPIAWFYGMTNQWVRTLLGRLETFLSGN
ncbi:MAG: glycosyltransferase family 39 protein [Bacteroides sp.]|nr:glycosyltransferase family 39 protein [Bacteroides sp.]